MIVISELLNLYTNHYYKYIYKFASLLLKSVTFGCKQNIKHEWIINKYFSGYDFLMFLK